MENLKKIIFSVDVEEWWSVHSFINLRFENQANDDRIEIGVRTILALLKKYNYTATFFVLGRVAEKNPNLIKEIYDRGHEIGSHGYGHKLIYEQSPDEFEHDLIRSLNILENIIQEKVVSYRAPSYSITPKSIWALEVLVKHGIKYDSSIVPTSNSRFGILNSPRCPYEIIINESGSRIIELPPGVIGFCKKTIPISSGFAFRLFPKFLINYHFTNSFQKNIQPMIIVHNWEVDPAHPYVNAGVKSTLIHYLNLKQTYQKLNFFFNKYEFNRIPANLLISKSVFYNDLLRKFT